MNDSIARQTFRNTVFNALRMSVSLLSSLLLSVIIARKLGPFGMGLYGYAMWCVGVLSFLGTLGIPAAVTKYTSEFIGREQLDTAAAAYWGLLRSQLWLTLGVSLAAAAVGFILFPHVGWRTLSAVVLLGFAQAVQMGLAGLLAGFQRYGRIAFASVISSLCSLVLVVFALAWKGSLAAILTASGLAVLVNSWLCAAQALRQHPGRHPAKDLSDEVIRRIRRFTLLESYDLFLDMIVWQSSEVVFLKWFSPLPQVAFYAIAFSFSSKLWMVGAAFTHTLIPLSSAAYGYGGVVVLEAIFNKGVRYTQIVMIPACLMGMVLARPLLELFFGGAYLPVAPVLQIMLASLTVTATGGVAWAVLSAAEQLSLCAKVGTGLAVFNVLLDISLIPRGGAVGAAIANCGTQVVAVVVLTAITERLVGGRFPWASLLRIYLCGLVATLPAFFAVKATVRPAGLAGAVVIGALIYLGALVAVGELGTDELRLVPRLLSAAPVAARPDLAKRELDTKDALR
ncbi:MAG TPA: oligosaccharide flippase family protein [Terriglobales bacterium]